MFAKINLLLSTINNLKYSQIFYQILNRLKRRSFVGKSQMFDGKLTHLQILTRVFANQQKIGRNQFNFLNLDKSFGDFIDWNFSDYGKLWTYNLEYFDYLHQKDLELVEKLRLIEDFYKFSVQRKRTLEPYPVSLRAINLIRFTVANHLGKQGYHNYLYQELDYLHKNYEFHILGNHLLENAFALTMGGAYFGNRKWHSRAVAILRRQLDEQILADGAHFELSPMYHKIIFFRLLELIDWYSKYEDKDDSFLAFCREKASLMLDWLENIRFGNGDIPLFNDSANGIAYPAKFLINYAGEMGIQRNGIPLGESGYRSFTGGNYEIKIDLAQIGASYQPGHAHADALSFIMYHNGSPLFVEQGTSTYQIGARRDLERSTEAHNTVVVDGRNQSQVWGGFRVAKRATTTIHVDQDSVYEASHDGYKKWGVTHTRKFSFEKESFKINDFLTNDGKGVFYLHLYPGSKILQKENDSFIINNKIQIRFSEADRYHIEAYKYAESYNLYQESQRIAVKFTDHLETNILF